MTAPQHHPSPSRPAPHRRLAAAALGTSAGTAALVAFFAARPDANPYLLPDQALARAFLSGPALTWTLLVVALLGVVTAGVALARPAGGAAGRLVAPVAVVEALTFGVLAQGQPTLPAAGYVVALCVPVLAVWAGVLAFRSRPRWRVPLVLVAALAVTVVVVARAAFATQLGGVLTGFARERWELAAVLVPLATATAWAGLALVGAWRRGSLRRATAWVTRHRRLFTIVAALGPLPYALARLTWLTPWPALATGGDLPAAVRIQGLSLSSGAWLGVVLTLGLILPWGERFPRWFPRRAGQPVPPTAAIVPGGFVAVMLCGAAIPMLTLMGWVGAVYFPAWFWGPALALAVWGYAGHRYGAGALDGDAGVSPAATARPAAAARR
ncbi:hypothetical protein [Isoptericola sp. NPDC057191]|uniref:hypothetical protein n=1 Tax=Isoptericola sp. NPDC057191 TaxID=3346041 RepID=UPI003638DBB6